MKYGFFSALLLSACTTVYSVTPSLTLPSESSNSQIEITPFMDVDDEITEPFRNLESPEKWELGWDFDEDNGKSKYFIMNKLPAIYGYAKSRVRFSEKDSVFFENLENLILESNSINQNEIQDHKDDLDYWKCVVNQNGFSTLFPTVKDLKQVSSFRILKPSSKSLFFMLYDADEKGVLYFDVINPGKKHFDIYETLRETYEEIAFDPEIDVASLQKGFIRDIGTITGGAIYLKFYRFPW